LFVHEAGRLTYMRSAESGGHPGTPKGIELTQSSIAIHASKIN